MSDWLKYYNLLDCRPLVDAILKSFEKFHEYFGVDPMVNMSLPSIAFMYVIHYRIQFYTY